jgi:hypothetical protein
MQLCCVMSVVCLIHMVLQEFHYFCWISWRHIRTLLSN